MLETSNFVHGSATRSLSLVMCKCSLSGRGQGHASNFCIVDYRPALPHNTQAYTISSDIIGFLGHLDATFTPHETKLT